MFFDITSYLHELGKAARRNFPFSILHLIKPFARAWHLLAGGGRRAPRGRGGAPRAPCWPPRAGAWGGGSVLQGVSWSYLTEISCF